MPVVSPNFAGIPRAAPDVITTTIFANGAPTAASSSSSVHASLPIGAIIGGLLAGVFLALAAVGGWVWWGKSIEKQSRKQPRLRSALKKDGRDTPSVNASKHSLQRTHPMASVSQKSVSFAPVPSPRSSDDSDPPQTPSPGASPDVPDTEDKDKGKQPSGMSFREPGASAPPTATWPRTPPPPRSALRPPASLRGQSTERAYAPVRPSPLSHATHPSPSTRPPRPIIHPIVDARPRLTVQGLSPPRQPSTASADRSSGVSAPSEYSQEGTASEGEPPFKMLRAPDGRLYAHRENDEPSGYDSGWRAHPNQQAAGPTRLR